jgi:hypothetical protein
MGIGASLFLIAAGAILKWAVEWEVAGVDLQTVGLILLIVGVLGLILSLLFWSSFSPFRRQETVVHEERPVYRQQ